MSEVKIFLMVQPNNSTFELEVDPAYRIFELFDFVKDQLSGNTKNWTCFSQEKGRYNEGSETLGNSFQSQTLIINTSDDTVLKIVESVQKELKVLLKINSDGTQIQQLSTEFPSSLTVSQLFDYLSESLKLSGNRNNWTCYSQEQSRFYQSQQEFIGQPLHQTLTIDISHNANDQQKCNKKTVHITISPINQNLEVKLDLSSTVREIFEFLKQTCKLPGDINNWRCFSTQLGKYYNLEQNVHDLLEQLSIYVFDDKQYMENINRPIWPSNRFFHKTIAKCIQIVQFNMFVQIYIPVKEDFVSNANLINYILSPTMQMHDYTWMISQKNQNNKPKRCQINLKDCQALLKNFKKIESKVQELMIQQKRCYEKALKYYENSHIMAQRLLENLYEQNILEYPNSSLEELVQIYQKNLIQKHGLVNNINYQTIQNNLERFNSIFDEFKKQIETINFTYIPQHECQIETKTVKYKQNNLNCQNQDDPIYVLIFLSKGKYLVILSEIKIEIWNNFQNITTLSYEIKENFVNLRDVGVFVMETLNNNNKQQINRISISDLDVWVYHSEIKNQELKKYYVPLYNFVLTDLIKINIAPAIMRQKLSNNMIEIKINIEDGDQKMILKRLLSQQCTIKDLQEVVLENCGIPVNKNQIEVNIYLQGQQLHNKNDVQKTLMELQINAGTVLKAIVIRSRKIIFL